MTGYDNWKTTEPEDADDYGDEAGADHGDLIDRCIDPVNCCNPHVYHDANECSFPEMYEDEPAWPHVDVPLVPTFRAVVEPWRPE